jgi:hypothetical protein
MAKLHLKLVTPATVNRTVPPTRLPNADLRTREYLTEAEVERLMGAARKELSLIGTHRSGTMADLAHDASGPVSSEPAGIALQQASRSVCPATSRLRRLTLSWFRLVVLASAVMCCANANAQQAPQTNPSPQVTVPCDAFQKNASGSWSATRQVTITSPSVRITVCPEAKEGGVCSGANDLRGGKTGQTTAEVAGQILGGFRFGGIDLYGLLEQQCH